MPFLNGYPERRLTPLPTIEFAKLAKRDPAEMQKLLDACKVEGFFYLNLSGVMEHAVEEKRKVMKFMEDYFDQPTDAKMEEDRRDEFGNKDHTVGYKPAGVFAGVEKGERDSYETLKVARSEMRDHSSALPGPVKSNASLFESYINNSQHITKTMLECLSIKLGLPNPMKLENYHRDDAPSRSTLVMLRYPRQTVTEGGVGHNKHTDIGSITFLWSDQWGLQVLSPTEPDTWLWVEPRRDQAVINVGDSLRFLSGHQLNSCVHRVVPTPEQEHENRFSLAYFLRAEDGAEYRDSHGRKITAKRWHDGKYETFGQDHKQQEAENILTGGMEKGEMLRVN